jgi:Uma2 family endonuclease
MILPRDGVINLEIVPTPTFAMRAAHNAQELPMTSDGAFCFPMEVPKGANAESFFQMLAAQPDLRVEREPSGRIIIMSPAGSTSARSCAEILYALMAWAKGDGTGYVFDSSGAYSLGPKSVRAPDASWVLRERFDALPAKDQARFAPLCPDFIVEVLSPSDSLAYGKRKMTEWLRAGVRLGWLISPPQEKAWVYSPAVPAILEVNFEATLTGEDVLPGFAFPLASLRF